MEARAVAESRVPPVKPAPLAERHSHGLARPSSPRDKCLARTLEPVFASSPSVLSSNGHSVAWRNAIRLSNRAPSETRTRMAAADYLSCLRLREPSNERNRGGFMTEPVTTLDTRFSDPDAVPTDWRETRNVLETAQLFWISTVRGDGRPHVTPARRCLARQRHLFHYRPGRAEGRELAPQPPGDPDDWLQPVGKRSRYRRRRRGRRSF